jgi:hypothetical protein
LTLFISATALFEIEPMVGKMILPKFGGTPAVWATCMMFFQLSLLAGYLYAHLISKYLGVRRQVYVHLIVIGLPFIAFVFFPLGLAYVWLDPPGQGNRVLWVCLILTMIAGLPFFVVSTTAPLMQKWFADTGHPEGRDPYFLYAASNLGSMLTLFAYPVIVEPFQALMLQGVLWMFGYAALAGLTVFCGYMVLRGPVALAEAAGATSGSAKLVADGSSEQIKEKPPAVESITSTPAAAETAGADNGDSTAAAADGADLAAKSEALADKPAAEEPQIAEKPAAVALKGAKRWRKKARAEGSEAITKTPAPSLKKTGPVSVAIPAVPELAGKPSVFTILHWIALAFVPSSLFIGVTTYMSTDIAAIPLLWIIPLAIYLLSFILVFGRPPSWVHTSMVLSLPVVVLLLVFVIVSGTSVSLSGVPRWLFRVVGLVIIAPIIGLFLYWAPARKTKMLIFLGSIGLLGLLLVVYGDPIADFCRRLPGIVLLITLNLLVLFIVCMVCHGELARRRPATQYLTSYFLYMSIGGALGGTFNALIAPVVFNSIAEYLLVVVAACMLLPTLEMDTKNTLNRVIDALLAIGLCLAALFAVGQFIRLDLPDIKAFLNEGGDFAVVQARYLTIPGIQPAIAAVIWSGLLVVLLGYIGLPKTGRLERMLDVPNPNWLQRVLARYILFRPQNFFIRLLDIVLPLALFMLTAELIQRSPFDSWNFAKVAGIFWGDTADTDLLRERNQKIAHIFTFGLPVALCYGFAEMPLRFGLGVGAILLAGAWKSEQSHVQYQDRSFFGVLKVEQVGQYRRLLHGTTLHGMQRFTRTEDGKLIGSDEPLTYYHKTGPVGQAYQAMISGDTAKANVAFIGLGTGTMASYINPGQTATFYEIDTKVIDISEPGDYFTYLKNCKARGGNYVFDIGDARLQLRNAKDHSIRLIVVDAFSSDAIPVHLITKEAVQLYFEKLTEDGIACIHISNRYLRLGPVLGNIAKELGFAAIRQYDGESDMGNATFPGKNASDWVVIARKPEYLKPLKLFDRLSSFNKSAYQLNMLAGMLQPNYVPILAGDGRWEALEPDPKKALWTDDFSNIISIFRWD